MKDRKIMDFNQYQTIALSTAIYPNRGKNLVYTVLGLNEEIGEAKEKLLQNDRDGLIKELGDVLWYISCCSSELRVSLQEIANIRTLIVTKPAPELFSQLYLQSSVISGRVKKIIRDNQGITPDDKKAVIMQSLAQCLGLIGLIAESTGSSLDEVSQINMAKLKLRLDAGTLKGDGDNR